MEQPVEQRRGDDGIAEHPTSFGKAAIGGEDHGATLVARVDELEEQVAAAGDHRQVADLVDDKQGRAGEEPDAFLQTALALAAGELPQQVRQGAEVDAAACLRRFDAERRGEMTLAGAGRAEEVDDLAAAACPSSGPSSSQGEPSLATCPKFPDHLSWRRLELRVTVAGIGAR